MARELKIDELGCEETGSLTQARVQLSLSGSPQVGNASAPSTDSSWQWVMAQATVNAVRAFINIPHELTLLGLSMITVAERPLIAVLMMMRTGREEFVLSGVAPILADRYLAVVKATLHGVNGRLERLLATNGAPGAEIDVAEGMRILRQLLDLVDSQSIHPAKEINFTPRELEILSHLADGRSNAEIAANCWISENTVKFHLKNLFRKLRVRDRGQAMMISRAIRRRFDSPTAADAPRRSVNDG